MDWCYKLLYKIVYGVFNNQLVLDKGTYFTILIGQITVYGIMLTFYQFVVSYQEPENAITSYLGENITEYVNKKELKAYKKIISQKLFGIILMLEILYKPFLEVFGNWCLDKVVKVLNFLWFSFVIFYFLIFVILFFECTKLVFKLKMPLNVQKNNELMEDIEHAFLKKTMKQCIKQLPVKLLEQDFDNLAKAVRIDDDPKLQGRYNELMSQIILNYTIKKEYEIDKKGTNRCIPRNQIPWRYNSELEMALLRAVVRGDYVSIDENNAVSLLDFCMKLMELNLKYAKKDGIEQINCDAYHRISNLENNKVFDASEWIKISEVIFNKLPNSVKRLRANKLYQFGKSDSGLYQKYCENTLYSIMSNAIKNVYMGKKETEEFLNVFGEIIDDNKVNRFYSDQIRDWVVYNSKIDDRAMLAKLEEKNATYLFVYIIMYYSIYRFRTDWKYINLNTMKTLWEKHGSMDAYSEEVVQRLKASNIGHRFYEEMYIKLNKYIHTCMSNNLLNQINLDQKLNLFYVWIIKVCIIDENNYVYTLYNGNYDADIQIAIVNELSKHIELMKNDQVMKWVIFMRYNTFSKMTELPENLNITLRNLLITDIECETFIHNVEQKQNYLLGSKDIGEYLLLKLQDLPLDIIRRTDIIATIKTAFVSSNMSVEEYIEMLEKESKICSYSINYVQKEKMRRYLVSIF